MMCSPAASVSGFYFSHTGSTHFKVGADQVEDMMRRRRVVKEEANIPGALSHAKTCLQAHFCLDSQASF